MAAPPTNPLQRFGVLLRGCRERAGRAVNDVAQSAGCAVSHLHSIEAGTVPFDDIPIVELIAALGIPGDDALSILRQCGELGGPLQKRFDILVFAIIESAVGDSGTRVWNGESDFLAWCTAHGHDPNDVRFQPLVACLRRDDEHRGCSIRFYRASGPYGWCSNYALYPVTIDGLTFATSEHYYQWAKYAGVDAAYAEAIRLAATPGEAWRMANDRAHPMRQDWERVRDDVMRLVVLHKFLQHEYCQRELLGTVLLRATLIEASPRDWYWGEGADRTGKNMLGRILMEVRGAIHGGTVEAYERDVRARLASNDRGL